MMLSPVAVIKMNERCEAEDDYDIHWQQHGSHVIYVKLQAQHKHNFKQTMANDWSLWPKYNSITVK